VGGRGVRNGGMKVKGYEMEAWWAAKDLLGDYFLGL
jgi:hypothetical protein